MRQLLAVWAALVACSSPPRPPPAPLQPGPAPTPVVVKPTTAPLAYLDGTLGTLATKYLDPARFDYRRMLRGALDGMEQAIAEVIAESTATHVTVRVDEQQRTFAGDVDSLSELGLRLTEVIRFVQQHASKAAQESRQQIELSAVNGMLHSLDPHTILISAKEMEEWNINLSGKFGGLGINIHQQAGRIAVSKVHANTPAQRGDLLAGDVIVAINGQSTETLTLDDAIERLRGDPGTPIKLVIERQAKQLDRSLIRAEIKIPVVASRMLDGKVGYVSLDRFDETTAKELEAAMAVLRDAGARAWVIDLRENVGGYLSQAVRSADLFVEYGTIVATVAGGKKHDIKNATSGGLDTRRPVVVLIGEQTASSAEILAGALKQLDRAALVGRRTFGKGSVQVLEDAAHGAKLKITTAEYVASGDISPQGAGIEPDIALVPARVPKQIGEASPLRLVPEAPFYENDLGAHLETTQKPDPDKPLATIAYRRDDDEAKDFEIAVARDLALAGARTRKETLERAAPRIIKLARAAAERDLAAALGSLGIDWSPGKPGRLQLAFEPAINATTGGLVTLRGSITNIGTTPASRVRARASSDDPALDGVELVFGKIPPRGTKQATAVVRLPRGSAARASTITWKLDSGETATTKLAIAGTQFPDFTLTAELADANDQITRAGETVRVRAKITNRGPGRSAKTVATLKSLVGERVLVDRGRIELGALEPNQSKDVELAFTTAAKLDVDRLTLDLLVGDEQLSVGQSQRLDITVGVRAAAWSLTPPRVRVDAAPLETIGERVTITGAAEDEQVVRDLYITTSNRGAKLEERKVFYKAGHAAKLAFTADVPLAPGMNRIIITAREHDKAQTVRTVWVVRR